MASPFHIAVWAILGVAAAAKAIHSYVRHSRDADRAARIAKGEHPPWFATYGTYMESEWWRRIRDATLEHLSYRCDFCGSHASQAHHARYPERDLWGTESVEFLCAVCLQCHDIAHGSRSKHGNGLCAFCASPKMAKLIIDPKMSRKRKYQEQNVCSRCQALALGNRAQALGWSQEFYARWIAEWRSRLRPVGSHMTKVR